MIQFKSIPAWFIRLLLFQIILFSFSVLMTFLLPIVAPSVYYRLVTGHVKGVHDVYGYLKFILLINSRVLPLSQSLGLIYWALYEWKFKPIAEKQARSIDAGIPNSHPSFTEDAKLIFNEVTQRKFLKFKRPLFVYADNVFLVKLSKTGITTISLFPGKHHLYLGEENYSQWYYRGTRSNTIQLELQQKTVVHFNVRIRNAILYEYLALFAAAILISYIEPFWFSTLVYLSHPDIWFHNLMLANFLADLIAHLPFLIFILGSIQLVARIRFMPGQLYVLELDEPSS